MNNDALKFTEMGGGFQDPYVNIPFDAGQFVLDLNTYSGGGRPNWVRQAPPSESAKETYAQCQEETMRMKEVFIAMRKEMDEAISKHLRNAGYTKVEAK